MVEGARLERVWAGNRLVGSNPTLSANIFNKSLKCTDYIRCRDNSPCASPYVALDSGRPYQRLNLFGLP